MTYTLEGDGALVFVAFRQLNELRQFIHVQNFPTVTTIVQQLFPDNVEQQRWYLYGLRECLMPAFQYYLETSANDAIVFCSIQVFQAQLFSISQCSCSTHDSSRHRGQLLQMLIGLEPYRFSMTITRFSP